MVDKPDIVKKLMEEEKLGKLESSSQDSHEDLEFLDDFPEKSFEDTSDEVVDICEEKKFTNHNDAETGSQISSENRYRLIAENTSDLISITTFSLKPVYIYVSPSNTRLLGYEPEELIGKNGFDFIHPDDRKNLTPLIKKYLSMKAKKLFTGKEHEIVERIEFRFSDKSGNWHYLESTVNIIGNELLFVSKDVTEQKKKEDEIDSERKQMLSIFDSMDGIIYVSDPKTYEILYANPALEKTFNKKLVGETCYKTIQNKKTPCEFCTNHIIFKDENKGKPYRWEFHNPVVDKDYSITDRVIKWSDGRDARFELAVDVTERKKAEEKLKESEEKYRLLVESSGIAITLFDRDGTYLFLNTIAAKWLNGKPDDYVGKSMYDVFPRDSADMFLERLHKIFKSGVGETIEEEVKSLNRWIFSNLQPVRNKDGEMIGVQILMEDITERKHMEEKLQESEEKFRTLYESATDAIMLLDENGFFDCNAAALRIFGLPSMNRFIYKHPNDLSPPKQPDGTDSYAAFNEHIATAYEKESDYFEWMHKRADGTIFPATVLLNHMKLKDRDILQAVVRNITEQKRKEKEIIKKNMDLKVVHKRLSSLNKDLEQKVKERTAEVEKILLQKDEFVGQLGHDLKNPLNPLVNLLPMLEERENDPETKKIFEVLNRNVNHMRNLVFNTIELARLKSSNVKLNIEDTNLLDEINNVIKMNNLLYEENNIEILNKADKNIIVKADKLRLTELFDNLIGNSVKYSPDGGTITIDAKQDKDFVTVSIKDTGIGITEGQLSHIFDDFYKVDKARHDFDSSGLGLPICNRIVKKHGGKMWAESKGEGKGTTMFFTLPISSEKQGVGID